MNVLATWLIACALNVWAESKPGGDSPADLKDGWVVSGPGEQGLNPDLLQAIGPRFEAWKEANAHAILVARHGVLVYERYFAGEDERLGEPIGRIAYDATMRHDVRSITKSVTSLLVGTAIDRGWIKDLDASVFSLLPKYADLRTPDKDRITLRHLLTMSAGFAWNEELPYSNPENSERLMIEAPDPIRYVLEQPLAATPGQIYRYSGGATALLAAVLQETSGKSLDVLAREVLFDPLDITDVEWMRYGNGEAMAASGLRLRPRDLAKIGQLVLAGGSWGSKRIVSASWIKESTTPKINGVASSSTAINGGWGDHWLTAAS
jgi:CubicO group peptidase (beta-lactamase class C family)